MLCFGSTGVIFAEAVTDGAGMACGCKLGELGDALRGCGCRLWKALTPRALGATLPASACALASSCGGSVVGRERPFLRLT